MKSMKLALIFICSVLLILSFPNGSLGSSCTDFKEFTLFPNPIQVGQIAHIRAVAPLTGLQGSITNGTIMVSVSYNGAPALQLANIPLCDSTSSIVCSSLGAGDNALSFDFEVPKIPMGIYSISVSANVGNWGSLCHDISLNVTDPSQTNTTKFFSYIQAQLAGSAQFENSNMQYRTVGDAVQIGPLGYATPAYANTYDWGKFLKLDGTEDVLTQQVNPSDYVWGLYGNLTEVVYGPNIRKNTYAGLFYVGYVSNSTKKSLDLVLIEGSFSLTWSYTLGNSGAITGSSLSGSIQFNDNSGTLPKGFSNPITVEKYGSLYVMADNHGVITVSGNKTYCLSGSCPESSNQAASSNPTTQGLTDVQIILIVCLTAGLAIVVALIVVLVMFLRRQRKFEEEDGIFSAARKPEYGNALVVDDIIQETREHGTSPMIPTLDRHPGDDDEYDDDDFSEDESELSDHRRNSRFSREVASPARPRSPSLERERERERERGRRESARYSNRRSRSNSVESAGRRRSMSPPRRDDESSYYSDDAGSSASRDSSSANDD